MIDTYLKQCGVPALPRFTEQGVLTDRPGVYSSGVMLIQLPWTPLVGAGYATARVYRNQEDGGADVCARRARAAGQVLLIETDQGSVLRGPWVVR